MSYASDAAPTAGERQTPPRSGLVLLALVTGAIVALVGMYVARRLLS